MSKTFKVVALILGLIITIVMFLNINGLLPKKENVKNNNLTHFKEDKINTSTSNKNKENNNTIDLAYNSEEKDILISSNNIQGVVSINSNTKKVDYKALDDKAKVYADKYINVDKKYMEYLKANSDSIIKEFNNGSMIEKYSLVNKILDNCDTNISEGDLINIALNYLK
ncbi:hypothetical protein [Romboutsia sp.]|uniref:hypothetical protein n=1 Tax=Romboutsia sp. TaxID=1965302 RepID=UPI003F349458